MPKAHPNFIVRSEEPLNGGPDQATLGQEFITPNELFFVRNHGPVPQVDAAAYRLSVGGLVGQAVSYSLDDLRQRFERAEVVSTLACAGQRRQEMAALRPIPGELPWGAEAVSTATWSGWRLRDVLAASQPLAPARHAAFEGLDDVERRGERFKYGASIPLDKAMSAEVLLADRMNGEPLPATHGYPLRVVVPGYIGARQVKWLAAIELRETSSENYFQRIAYRRYPSDMDAASLDPERGVELTELEVNCVITAPLPGEVVGGERFRVTGVAYAGDGGPHGVELSIDGGATWTPARLQAPPRGGRWAWRLFEGEVALPGACDGEGAGVAGAGLGVATDVAVTKAAARPGEVELLARARDANGRSQPADARALWNFKGYMNNAWCRVRVRLGSD